MKFAPLELESGPSSGAAPAKNEPRGRLRAIPSCVIGKPPCARTNWDGRGSTSKTPKPPRRAVLPLWNGSHANPTRGSKLRSVGFEKKRSAHLGCCVRDVGQDRELAVDFGRDCRRFPSYSDIDRQVWT